MTTATTTKAPPKGAPVSTVDAPAGEATTPLDVARGYLTRYLVVTDTQADCLALWAAHTWCLEAFEVTPYISIQSIEPAAGKTVCLEVLEQIVASPWLTGRTTGPALVRKVAQDKPTLLLDEVDACFTGGQTSQQMLRGVLNSGYRLGGQVSYAQGGTFVDLPVFCCKAFAGLTELPTTVRDRSVPIVMRRKTSLDKVERARRRDVREAAHTPRVLLMRFGMRNLEQLAAARPAMPEALDDRACDVWEPLVSIADLAGGTWPERARKAAVELMNGRRKHVNANGTVFRLLTACHAIFEETGVDRLPSARLVEALLESDEWADYDGRALNPILLADALRGFGVTPTKLRAGKTVCQGYYRAAVESAYRMVVPEDVPVVAATDGDE